jgi:hypothetical protein
MLKTADQESNISKSVAKADLINEISVLSRCACTDALTGCDVMISF